MLIPGLIRRSRSTALGLCGATSMDFTLPVLQRTGGLDMVPAAIVHGFILSLLVPILIAFFSLHNTSLAVDPCRQNCAKSISLKVA